MAETIAAVVGIVHLNFTVGEVVEVKSPAVAEYNMVSPLHGLFLPDIAIGADGAAIADNASVLIGLLPQSLFAVTTNVSLVKPVAKAMVIAVSLGPVELRRVIVAFAPDFIYQVYDVADATFLIL